MEAIAVVTEHSRVIPFEGWRAAGLRRQLAEALPAGAEVELGRHSDVDPRAGTVLNVALPARPNPTLPGRDYPASAVFAIEISWQLLQRHFNNPQREHEPGASLAQWIALHISGAAPTGESVGDLPPLVWRFTTPPDDISDVRVQRVRAA